MLRDFLVLEKTAILADCQEKVLSFGGALSKHPPVQEWTVFYDDLVDHLTDDEPGKFIARLIHHADSAELQSGSSFKLGYSVYDVVKGYEALYLAIAERAAKVAYILTTNEHSKLSLSFGAVVAETLSGLAKEQSRAQSQLEVQRLGEFAHELRNNLQAATIGLEMMSSGSVGADGNTSESVQRSLQRMGSLIDTTLTEVRMRVEPTLEIKDIQLIELVNEVLAIARFVARTRKITLQLHGQYDLVVLTDRQLTISALSNVIQNALKYTREGTTVRLSAVSRNGRIIMEVEDQCGGLPPGAEAKLFKPFVQQSADHSGMGLGLTISFNAIKRCNGTLSVRDKPGSGCVFTIDLPEGDMNAAAAGRMSIQNWP